MYITTFYSFKGGVGRSMALVNAAVTLAQRGRRILVVDFDIEAPGLDTFDALRPKKEVPGLIDFISEYVKSGNAPDVADYIGDCPDIGEEGGKIWIMPSGNEDTYASTLAQIDWADLYLRRDGYVLFEDLKEQWFQVIQPDYVLIDSRTGHTDASGICTRQLPDSVVILFFPNEQNLRGLTKMVRDIRAEVKSPRRKRIELHFVMSNVPDLDDEDLILQGKIAEFQEQLGFKHDPIIVHRYDSLSLLNQAVFSRDRPRSRLAEEYERIVREISTLNWKDREGALEYIRRARHPRLWSEDDETLPVDERLERIEQAHGDDGEILFRLGTLRESEFQFELAAQLINQAIEVGYDQPDALLRRSQFRERNDDQEGAIEDAWRVLESQDIAPRMVRSAATRLARLERLEPRKFAESNAVTSLDINGKRWLAGTFNHSRDELLISASLWEENLASPGLKSHMRDIGRHELGMSYMGLGRCSEAAAMFCDCTDDFADLHIRDAFNYGMAIWGAYGNIDQRIFERVVELDRLEEVSERTANYHQYMAVSYWATDNTDKARDHLDRSEQFLTTHRRRFEFSCWRYLEVTTDTFRSDLKEIRDMIEGVETRSPHFMTDSGVAGLDC